MTPEEYERLRSETGTINRMVGTEPGVDRTLLYGYDVDRRTWHVYQKHGWLHHVIYLGSNPKPEFETSGERLDARSLVPNKRLYPHRCDFFFCRTLKALEIHLPFTTFENVQCDPAQQFIGRTF